MRRSRRVQKRYRGSRGVGVLIPVLVVLCIAAAAALFFINENIVHTKEGTSIELKKEEKTVTESEESELKLVIEEPDEPTSSPTEEQASPAQDKVVAPAITEMKGFFVPITVFKDTSAFDAALASLPGGINTVVLEVKSEDGMLAFASDSPLAIKSNVSGNDDALTAAIAKIREKGCKVAFYMSCFKDNDTAKANPECAARTENKTMWRDGTDIRWLSAYSDDAKVYLASLITKLITFAPDEIILSNISFPAIGRPEILAYDESLGTKDEMLRDFIAEAKAAAGETPLSALYENYNSRRLPISGQSAGDFKAFEKIYVDLAQTQYTLTFDTAKTLFEGFGKKVIPVGADNTAEEYIIRR